MACAPQVEHILYSPWYTTVDFHSINNLNLLTNVNFISQVKNVMNKKKIQSSKSIVL